MNLIRGFNLSVTGLGAVIFSAFFLFVSYGADDFARRVIDFTTSKVQIQIQETLPALQAGNSSKLAAIASKFDKELGQKTERIRTTMESGLTDYIVQFIADHCAMSCAEKEKIRKAINNTQKSAINNLSIRRGKLVEAITGKYETIVSKLRNELRLFSSITAATLLLAFLLSLFKARASAHLLPIACALSVATLLAASWYIFGQNWLLSIVFSDYLGWTYLIVIGILAGFLLDIAVNKARVTTNVLNGIAEIFGSAGSLLPC